MNTDSRIARTASPAGLIDDELPARRLYKDIPAAENNSGDTGLVIAKRSCLKENPRVWLVLSPQLVDGCLVRGRGRWTIRQNKLLNHHALVDSSGPITICRAMSPVGTMGTSGQIPSRDRLVISMAIFPPSSKDLPSMP
ncbi:hypothetical protein D7B24_004128 [Verticillium nonalfalfae]|uniref:Uncharacterized protein n=1 Tax=Verticillium nonalfalfae TaxID=1051616 RepID=A0A3M9YF25_9PEZI|nr:uncharacterized protein D7B24_004128 [Verticillium nonalfalfae]RNJ58765.1 hypothetical protein D7B24_004128 [Verticillium nonalfalfae]